MGVCGSKSAAEALAPETKHGPADTGTAPNNVQTPTSDGANGLHGAGGALIKANDGLHINDSYFFDKDYIGRGTYGKVFRVVEKTTGSVRAVKVMSKKNRSETERFRQEIAIMKLMNHPNSVKLFETFEDRDHLYLVMELCVGGPLMDHLTSESGMAEEPAMILMQQIFRAVYYMHKNFICHRDLKPDNFLLLTRDPVEKNILKIADFGLSRICRGEDLTTKAGTLYYSSPEVLNGKYDMSTDLWSCGVIMFLVLSGSLPFDGKTDAEILKRVRAGNYSCSGKGFEDVSQEAKGLIRNLLKFNRQERTTAEQALRHECVAKINVSLGVDTHAAMVLSLLEQFRAFCGQNALQKAVRHVIAQSLDESQVYDIRKTFMLLDADSDSLLTVRELQNAVSAGVRQEDVPRDMERILSVVCPIDYRAFLALTLDLNAYQDGPAWDAAFSILDRTGDDRISRRDLEDLLSVRSGEKTSTTLAQAVRELLHELEVTGTKEIDHPTFRRMLCEGPVEHVADVPAVDGQVAM